MSLSVSIVIPTFNGASRIRPCIESILDQSASHNAELLVVSDGSTDGTERVVRAYPGVRVISQPNTGPAVARNRGAAEARGQILLFTDDDCVPQPGWFEAMLRPFRDPSVVGVKGVYRTQQREIVARFVQIEYEDRYRLMSSRSDIDFIDTYSAGFLRDRFLEMRGYDSSFPVACAEDIELSYRMSARGWKLKFNPGAVVCHTHPATLVSYLKKKYKFAYWRVLAVRKNPRKCVRDSHTPQIMKLQLLFPPALLLALIFDLVRDLSHRLAPFSLAVLAGFLLTALPFSIRALRKDPIVGLLSPALLAARACAQFLGVIVGLMRAKTSPRDAVEEPALRPDPS